MKTAIRTGGPTSGGRDEFERMLTMATEAEALGVDSAWPSRAGARSIDCCAGWHMISSNCAT